MLYYISLDIWQHNRTRCDIIMMKKQTKKTIKDVLFSVVIMAGMVVLVYVLIKYQHTVWSINAITTW